MKTRLSLLILGLTLLPSCDTVLPPRAEQGALTYLQGLATGHVGEQLQLKVAGYTIASALVNINGGYGLKLPALPDGALASPSAPEQVNEAGSCVAGDYLIVPAGMLVNMASFQAVSSSATTTLKGKDDQVLVYSNRAGDLAQIHCRASQDGSVTTRTTSTLRLKAGWNLLGGATPTQAGSELLAVATQQTGELRAQQLDLVNE